MFEIFVLSIRNNQKHSNFTYSNSICYQHFRLFVLTKVCLFNFRCFSFFRYHSEATIGNVSQIPQNKRLLANTNFDKIFEKYLTDSSFIIKMQTLSLKIHWKINSFKGNFQRLFQIFKKHILKELLEKAISKN